jgi:hypothetical protein
LVLMMIGG